jgi:hypothetical protein
MWPVRDPVDMLVDQHTNAATNLLHAMDVFEAPAAAGRFEQHLAEQTPKKAFDLVDLDPSPMHNLFLTSAEPSRSAPPVLGGAPGLTPVSASEACAPGLTPLSNPNPEPLLAEISEESPARDPLMLNLNERLASLDAIVQCLSHDIADIKSDTPQKMEQKMLHRI